jgi:hypothetical protein
VPLPVKKALKRKGMNSESKAAKEYCEKVEVPPKRKRKNLTTKKAEIGDAECDTDDHPQLPSFDTLCGHMLTNRSENFEALLTIAKQR